MAIWKHLFAVVLQSITSKRLGRFSGEWSQESFFTKKNIDVFRTFGRSSPKCEKGVLKNFSILTGKHVCLCLFLRMLYAVNITNFLRTPILKDIMWTAVSRPYQASMIEPFCENSSITDIWQDPKG